MNRKDSKRYSRLEIPFQSVSSNGVNNPAKCRQGRRRRRTCPSLAEINNAMVAVSLVQLGKGCSLEELIEKCIQSFDADGKLWRNEEMVHMTLVMHSWVVPSAEFAQKLLQLYRDAAHSQKILILHLIGFWSNNYPEVFRLDSKLEDTMSNFWEVLKERGGPSHHQINDPTQGFDQDIIKTLPGSPSFNKKRKVSLLFDHLEPSELADHLSCLEFKCFCRISHLDYRNYTLQSSLREIPRLERSVALCNSISQWVQLMILNRPTPQQRAEVFTKFIQVTQKLRKHQNFNTLMAVIGGLCHSAISRLKETHSYLAQEILKTMSEMTELVSSSSNYSTYRRVYNECMGFKIPILGVQLKDLVSLNEALPDYLDNGKINVNKLHSLYQHILELLHLQKMVPPFKADKDVILLLKSSLDLFHTEDEIYSLSYAREPRSHKSLPSAGYKPSAGIEQWPHTAPLQPDPETLSNCVEQMVESVFQLCDPDQKGYISLDDFDKIVASLPFSFHILEKDHDGPVSRHEMTLFFRKACHMGTKLGVNFVQSLVETRLKNSLLSGNCIWAMAKQALEVDIMQSCSWKPVSCAEIHSNCRVNNNLCQKTTQTDKSSIEDSPALYPAAEGNSIPRTLCGDSCRSQSLLEELQVLEKERDNLLLENAGLHCSNSQLSTENARLQNQLFGLQEEIRTLSLDSKIQPSITRILDPMDSLHLQCDGKL